MNRTNLETDAGFYFYLQEQKDLVDKIEYLYDLVENNQRGNSDLVKAKELIAELYDLFRPTLKK